MKTEKGSSGKICFDPLSPEFVLAKPLQQEAFDVSVIYELERNNNLIITRKRDGYKLFAVKANGVWKIYTDGINEVHCLDHIKKELTALRLADETILVGEGIADVKDSDDFSKVGSVFKSNPARALEVQAQVGFIKFMIFGVVFLDGKSRIGDAYSEQLKTIYKILHGKSSRHLMAVPILAATFDEAKAEAVKEGWEGLVLYAKDFSSSFRLDGKNPARPKGCYKWKPIYEDDFAVKSFILSPDNPELVKEVLLTQIDPKTKKEFDCGKFGLFSTAMRKELKTAKYPFVVQLKFETRFVSGKLRNARFIRIRTDKKPSQCVAPKSFKSLS